VKVLKKKNSIEERNMLIKQLSQFKLMRNKKFAIKKKKRKKLGEVFSKKVRKL